MQNNRGKITNYKVFKTQEDWEKVYWEIKREGIRIGKKDIVESLMNCFPWGSLMYSLLKIFRANL